MEEASIKSSNGGAGWTAVNTGLTNTNIQALAIDPDTPKTLYAGTYGGGLFQSSGDGAGWTSANTGLTNTLVQALAIDPKTPEILYVGTNGGGVFKSANGGAGWSPVNTELTCAYVQALVIDPQAPTTLYAGTYGAGVFKSSGGGSGWTAVNTGLTSTYIRVLAIDPKTATVYAGTGGAGVFKSTNGGAGWTAVNTGLTNEDVLALAIDPQTPTTLYSSNWEGVFKSTNGGDSWSAVNAGLTYIPVYALAIDPQTPTILYAGTYGGGIFKSTNGGAGWSPINTGLTGLMDKSVLALAIDPQTPTILYAGTAAGGVLKSANGGDSWGAVNTGLTSRAVSALAIDPQTPTILYVGTLRSVFRSQNGGADWSAVNTGLTYTPVPALVIDPQTPQSPTTLYAGTSGLGVFKLVLDGTLHFSQFGNGLGFTSDVVLTNPSPAATVAGTITSADDNGLPLSAGLDATATDFSILPQGALTLSTNGVGELAVGSALVTANGPLGGVVRFSIPGKGIAGVGASEPMSGFIAPVRRTAGGVNTGVALSNAELHAVTLDLMLRDPQGQEVPGSHRTIESFPARGHLARFIDELFPEAQSDHFEGAVVVNATGGQISATALELGPAPGQFTTLPVTPLTAGGTATEISFAQFGSGGGFTSDTVLVNPRGAGSVSGTLTLLNDQGQPMPVGLGGSGLESSRWFSIPPLGALTISTDGGGSLNVGSARVSASGPLGGVVRFQIPGIGIAGVGESRPLTQLLIPVRRTPEGISTGIALQNSGAAAVTVALSLRDTTGTVTPGGIASPINLAAGGHLARFVEELFPEADTQNFQGTLSVEVTGGTVAASALELGSKPGEFTTLPVTPVE